MGSGWGTHVNPWLIHFNVWQNPLQEKKEKKDENVKMDSRGVKANILTIFLFSGLYDYKGFLAALFKIFLFLNLKFK